MQAAITATTQQSRFHTETLEAVAQVGALGVLHAMGGRAGKCPAQQGCLLCLESAASAWTCAIPPDG